MAPFKLLAADDAFTIRNVQISSTADDPASAKIKAIEAGQTEAFKVLLGNLGAEDNNLKALEPKDIAALVSSYQVQNEKISGSRYQAILNVTFSQEMIKGITKRQNVAQKPASSNPPLIVIPLIYEDEKPILFESENSWLNAWRDGAKESRVPLVVPKGDQEDIKIVTPSDVINGNINALMALAKKYGVRDILVTIAEPNNGNLRVSAIKLSGGNTTRQDFNFPIPDAPGPDFLNSIVTQISIYLEKTVREQAQGKPEPLVNQPRINIQANFRDISEWIAIKDKISKMDSLTKMEINELGTNSANLTVYLQPNVKDVNGAFAKYGMGLEDVGGGRFALVNLPPQALQQRNAPIRNPENTSVSLPSAPTQNSAPLLAPAEKTAIKDTPINDTADDDILKAAAAERSKQEKLNLDAKAAEKKPEIAVPAEAPSSAVDEAKPKQP